MDRILVQSFASDGFNCVGMIYLLKWGYARGIWYFVKCYTKLHWFKSDICASVIQNIWYSTIILVVNSDNFLHYCFALSCFTIRCLIIGINFQITLTISTTDMTLQHSTSLTM
jgi:hypothetical protein